MIIEVNVSTFPINEYNYLQELYESTNGSNWFDNTNISYNFFSGPFPSCFWNFPQLTTLSIGYNSLTGSIPTNVFSIPQLIILSMPENCFDGGFDEDDLCNGISKRISVINLNSLHSTKCRNTRGMNGMT